MQTNIITDIILPNNNEKEFVKIAERLNYTELYLTYTPSNKESAEKQIEAKIENLRQTINQLQKTTKIKLSLALLVTKRDLLKIKKSMCLLIAEAADNARWLLEKSKADIIFNLEQQPRKDFIHSRASGLNQVLCKIAKEKDKTIAFNFSLLLKTTGRKRAVLLGRMQQNTKLCNKYKVKTLMASFATKPLEMRSPHELNAILSL